ncbi:MAG: FliH/SctL family protein [Acidobacteriaceae bacterium]
MTSPSELKDVMGEDVTPLPTVNVEAGSEVSSVSTLAEMVEPLVFRIWEAPIDTTLVRNEEQIYVEDPLQPLYEQIAALESRLTDEAERNREMVEQARHEGYAEGGRVQEELMAQRIEEMQRQARLLVERFEVEKEQYFRRVEREVVRLSLAIAARVLHREAQMDPLLLAGAVRVAIEKLADTSGTVMRTALSEVSAWQEMFRSMGEARILPEVIGDPALQPGECVLETRLGTVELGVRAQLEEIEKGFFDLLDQKPQSSRSSL